MEERWRLCIDRLEEIKADPQLNEPFGSYFRQVASFLLDLETLYEKALQKEAVWNQETNDKLYGELQEGSYVNSFANPSYAVSKLGKPLGQLLSCLYSELFSMPAFVAEGDLFEILIRTELFVEAYCITKGMQEEQEKINEKELQEALLDCAYWFLYDYLEEENEKRVGEKVDPAFDFAYRLIMESDLSDISYLYRYGEYIGENQIETARLLNTMPYEELKKMADTYTEGYRIGFVKGNKDLSKKEVVNIMYPLGFEQVVKIAIENFKNMGLRPTLIRTAHSIFHKRGLGISGFYSTGPNRQFDYDHKEDEALFLDKKLLNRRLETFQNAYEKYKEISAKHAGPALIEVFGEKEFIPEDKPEACRYNAKQQKLAVTYSIEAGKIINSYIPGEERSFTIIAFPIPEIGKDYKAIMEETIALNTLPYEKYERIQQVLIDALDACEYVKVLGMNGNRTDLRIELCKLKDPAKETKFENCVADVNIPVGEVFTSPVLKGTEGTLHVKQVYLKELSYENLEIHFLDGMVKDYTCTNYEKKEQNQSYIKDNVLSHFDSLPIGEFAIGTNTTAYVMGRKYGIENKLPILIAEKTGPHFAVGDTCYSHAEDVAVYNPDGKEIVARDNEISLLRKDEEKQGEAYFQCHTDITIPYDELGRLYGVTKEGKEIDLIREGRFVLAGTEALNEPF